MAYLIFPLYRDVRTFITMVTYTILTRRIIIVFVKSPIT